MSCTTTSINITIVDRASPALLRAEIGMSRLHLLDYLMKHRVPNWLAKMVAYHLPSKIILWWSRKWQPELKGEA